MIIADFYVRVNLCRIYVFFELTGVGILLYSVAIVAVALYQQSLLLGGHHQVRAQQGLAGARSSGDLERLARHAHKIKGAPRLVGAHPLAAAAEAAEAAAKSADWSQVLPLCADVETAVARLRLHVQQTWG